MYIPIEIANKISIIKNNTNKIEKIKEDEFINLLNKLYFNRSNIYKLFIFNILAFILSFINSKFVFIKGLEFYIFLSIYSFLFLIGYRINLEDFSIKEKIFFRIWILMYIIIFIFCMILYFNNDIYKI